jgi:hypothetical protein
MSATESHFASLNKTSYLVSFLQILGNPIIGFIFPEGSIDGHSFHVHILPNVVSHVLELNQQGKARLQQLARLVCQFDGIMLMIRMQRVLVVLLKAPP